MKRAPRDWPKRSELESFHSALQAGVLYIEGQELLDGRKYPEAIRKYSEVAEKWPRDTLAVPAAYNCACAYVALGEKARAMDWLEKAVQLGLKDVDRLEENPELAPLRDDVRYKKLISNLKDE